MIRKASSDLSDFKKRRRVEPELIKSTLPACTNPNVNLCTVVQNGNDNIDWIFKIVNDDQIKCKEEEDPKNEDSKIEDPEKEALIKYKKTYKLDNYNDSADDNEDKNNSLRKCRDYISGNSLLLKENDSERHHSLNREQRCKESLRNAFIKINLSGEHINMLLETLRQEEFMLKFLPSDSRSLLGPVTITAMPRCEAIDGGEYLYIGFKNAVISKLYKMDEANLPQKIIFDFNINRAKIKTSVTQFWLIQCRIKNISDKTPMIIGIFKGNGKPGNAFQFFYQFVNEILKIKENGGLLMYNRVIPLEIRCFIADATMRAFALNHQDPKSVFPCSKCRIRGDKITNFVETTVFCNVRSSLRTDDEYCTVSDKNHRKGESPLAPLIGLVSQVPFESMQTVYSGIVKQMLCAHINGEFGRHKLDDRLLKILDYRMTFFAYHRPKEFTCKLIRLTAISDWKATDFREFLLYRAPSVLYGILPQEFFEHFMLLQHIIRSLNSGILTKNDFVTCHVLLETFVMASYHLYGEPFMTYKLHAILHIVADVQKFGILDSFSAFPYESNISKFRKYLRQPLTPSVPLQEFYKKIVKRNNMQTENADNSFDIILNKKHSMGPLPCEFETMNVEQYEEMKIGTKVLSVSVASNCCILKNSEICQIANIIKQDEDIYVIVNKFLFVSTFYTTGIYCCSNLSTEFYTVHVGEILNRCYSTPNWSNLPGEEDKPKTGEYICSVFLTPLQLKTEKNELELLSSIEF